MTLSPSSDRLHIGVIGLGNMGGPMALTLLSKGMQVSGFDLSSGRCSELASQGLAIADDLTSLCQQADILLLSLPTAQIVEAVVINHILPQARSGSLVIDTSTSHPDTSRALAKALAERQIGFVDAPVSGGPKGAASGTLSMVLGGSDADIERAQPVLEAVSAKRTCIGPVGAGHITKIANNLLCAAHLLTNAEIVRLAQQAGVDPVRVLEGVSAGSGRSGISEVNFPLWVFSGQFDSGFTMQLMRKDVRLGKQLADELGLDLALLNQVAATWAASAGTLADGEDFNAIVKPIIAPEHP
ncbi:NAD(P)-dependent oxidoreductase [Pokkaliibacter sp. MBI-7]|uniref:NAD(P)-dependent oxidoreductase n=1 Tax=Pokkaliibacter sp. MBI-7 TaxID=3040600 RepID=UPI002447AB58|nr:NAD(P)-dependent oxidoreductase [Pokkaliibacter sp. MBI-7]MDH2433754.1 NAD(P)-dependent oxidoreductase [Pokkaliibacter sp. MBI-7]